MTVQASSHMASLTVEKPGSMSFQDVTVMDRNFTICAHQTLNESRPGLTMSLPPGRYMVGGLSPSGTRRKITVELQAYDDQTVTVDARQPPHESLAENTAGNPSLYLSVGGDLFEIMGSWSLNSMRAASPVSSLSLPGDVVSYAEQGRVEDAIETLKRRFRKRYGRPKRETRRSQDVNIRTYCWATNHSRWLRSDLIDRAEGDSAMGHTRLVFPSRQEVDEGLREKIHLVGVFRKDLPARFIALPLFAQGAQLVLSHSGTGVGEKGGEPQALRFSWYLSALDERIDALVQSLKGRGFESSDAVSEEASKVAGEALRYKIQDPEAAVVAALFLLRHRKLDDRADWVENLANWFPWSPDALALGAWGNLLFETGDQAEVLAKLTRVQVAGPPQFLPARRLLRDLVSILRDEKTCEDLPRDTRGMLDRLWARLGREMQHEVAGGPFYSFTAEFGAAAGE